MSHFHLHFPNNTHIVYIGDIREATKDAVRYMISFLGIEHGLDKEAAYMLCSVAGDLRLHEVVSLIDRVF